MREISKEVEGACGPRGPGSLGRSRANDSDTQLLVKHFSTLKSNSFQFFQVNGTRFRYLRARLVVLSII